MNSSHLALGLNQDLEKMNDFMTGKILLEEEIPFSDALRTLAKQLGRLQSMQGIERRGSKWRCNRCLCEDERAYVTYRCAKCNKRCVYCRHCIQMKRVASCDQLLVWNGPSATFNETHVLAWQGSLTTLQQNVSAELVQSVQKNEPRLIHAVCGAGKTEMLFPAIFEALEAGKRVCVATPRTDVVLELFPRFQQAFPKSNVQALYGGAEAQMSYSPLVLATTHQLYRFHRAFDVIFVDEADAFPYTYDKSLQYAVQKAKKETGVVMLVTATPDEQMKRQFIERKQYSFLPRRFHGHPLPVPTFELVPFYTFQFKKGIIPKAIKRWVKKCIENDKPFLLFFHHIERMKEVAPLFQQLDPSIAVVYANDPERKEKVLALRERKRKGLLTTTILERGITIPKLQVAIVGAEKPLFDAGALIQISGRVGRAVDEPTGDIVFFHEGITRAMDEARLEIIRLNEVKCF